MGKARVSSTWLPGALGKVDHHDGEVSGLWRKSPGWRPFFVSGLDGVQENG